MRTLSSASAVTVAAAVSLLLAPSAYADGDRGTVTLHDAATDELLTQDEPEVCTFSLHGAGFDVGRRVGWQIVEMPPTGTRGRVAEVGALSLNEAGDLRSGTLSLVDGRYRLVWNVGVEGGPAGQRVFWVDCDGGVEQHEKDGVGSGGAGSGEPSVPAGSDASAPGPDGSSEPGPVTTPATTPGAEGAGGDARSGGPSPQASPSGGSDLAETGSHLPAGALAAAAASLLGAGTYLLLRRREPEPQRR